MSRVYVAARVSPDVAEAFNRLCTRRGITFTALVQAWGETVVADPAAVSDDVILRARAIDRERGSRR